MYEAYIRNNNRLPYQHLENILKEVKPDHDWMTRNILNKAFRKYRLKMNQNQDSKSPSACDNIPEMVGMKKSDSLLSEISNVSSAVKSKPAGRYVGRPVGKTFLKKKTDRLNLISAKNEIVRK